MLMTPHPLPIEHWFEAAVERSGVKEVSAAVEIAERARRHRFFTSLEFGGRLESLRWILEAARECLPQEALLQRQDILARYPAYNKLSQQAREIRSALGKLPLVAEDQAALKEQMRQLAELGAIGAKQEAILREIALRREPASLVFPPLLPVADVQKSLPDKQAALAFFATGRRLYGFLLNNERCSCWQVGAAAGAVAADSGPAPRDGPVRTEPRDGREGPRRREVEAVGPASPRRAAEGLAGRLLAALRRAGDRARRRALVSAVRGVAGEGGRAVAAADVAVPHPLRPDPLALRPAGPGRNPTGNTAVVVGKLYPNDKDEVTQKAFEQLAAVVPGAVLLRPPPPAPSALYSTLFQRLIVLEDLVPSDDPYGWNPAPLDRSKPGGTVADWLVLPWGRPDVILLPGFHTAAEDALKRVHRGPPGNEMFLSVCGLMASGARTLLLSRWRTGGQSSFDLVREFAQELPHTSPADAWQRAVLLDMDSRVNLEGEPRIKRGAADETPKASHPFFWAGYMLVDCTPPPKPEPKPEEPVLKPKKR